MQTRTVHTLILVAAILGGFAIGRGSAPHPAVHAQADDRVYEIRIYTVEDGKVGLLSEVFRQNVTRMFAKHGMTNVAYFVPRDDPACVTAAPTSTILSPVFDERPCSWSQDTLIYILGHDSPEAAEQNWASFTADAEGLASFRDDYARAGVQVMKIESVFMRATDYSPLR